MTYSKEAKILEKSANNEKQKKRVKSKYLSNIKKIKKFIQKVFY